MNEGNFMQVHFRDTMSTSIQAVQRFLSAENRRDWEQWASFLHPAVQYEVVGSPGVVRGRDNYVRHMQEAYAKLPDWQFQIRHISGDEGWVIVEFDGVGHFSGEHGGRQYARAPLHLTSVCVFGLERDRIVTVREYFDAVGFQHQLQVTRQHRSAKELVTAFLQAENVRDWTTYAQYLAPNVCWITFGPAHKVVQGRDAYVAAVQKMYAGRDARFVVEHIASDEVRGVVFVELVIEGLHSVDMFVVQDGYIVSEREYLETGYWPSACLSLKTV
ncbi:MAG: nuclear transport factor 2 family protein [Spirochaetota bacterium]